MFNEVEFQSLHDKFHMLWQTLIEDIKNCCINHFELIPEHHILCLSYLFFCIFHLAIGLSEARALIDFSKLCKEVKLLEILVLFPSDFDDIRGEVLNVMQELVKSMICVAN